MENILQPKGKDSGKKYVCISYSSKDKDKVFDKCVYPLIKIHGLNVYWDEDFRNNASKAWNAQMLDNIESSEAVLLFVSNSYIASYACLLEALFSYVYEKKVILIKLDWNLVNSPNTDPKTISDSTLKEFNYLLRELNKPEVSSHLPKGSDRFLSKLVDKKSISPRDVSEYFRKLISKFDVTQLDINDMENSQISLVNSIKGISEEVFDLSNIQNGMSLTGKEEVNVKIEDKDEKTENSEPLTESDEYHNYRVGQLANIFVRKLLEEERVTKDEVELLQDLDYCKKVFDINFPLLVKVNSIYDKERYYKPSLNVYGVAYLLCSQWFEGSTNNDRPYILKWIKDHENNETISYPIENVNTESTENTEKRTKSSSISFSYSIYGKSYPDDNQAEMMVNVFVKVLAKHTDMIPQLIPIMHCLSDVNYEDNKSSDMPVYFRSCRYIDKLGNGLCIGTAYGLVDKIKLIARLLVYCNEPIDVLTIDNNDVYSELVKWFGKYNNSEKSGSDINIKNLQKSSGDENYILYGQEYSGNQGKMMIDALNAIITRHFDMREEIASKLSSVKLEDINDLKAKGISYFRVGETFTYQGIKYSIGTSFNRDAKLGQIEKAISICNEDPKNFIIEGLKISDSNGNRISSKKSSVKRDFLND